MNTQDTPKKREAYIKPMVHWHEPLRNVTAAGPNGVTLAPTVL